jgi:hypothetical protein
MSSDKFPSTSRYFPVANAQLTLPDGRTVVYLQRRFLPDPAGFSVLEEHRVAEGERLDHVTAQHLGDPEQFWRIADANRAMHPRELVETVGRVLAITLPEGIPGPSEE